MATATWADAASTSNDALDFDVIIIGGGIAGLCQLYRCREAGMRVRLFESGTGVGGAWYWNKYPGARFDSESYSYAYSFSQELLQEWNWSEHFAGQPEILRYLNFVTDRFGMRDDIRFQSAVTHAQWQEKGDYWDIAIEDGSRFTARFVIAAIGPLSIPTYPRIEGRESFAGISYHTSRWPEAPVPFEGKRVAVIGTGATGVQTIQEVSKTAGHLTVFQRTANYCAPLNNGPISDAEQPGLKAGYPEMFARCASTNSWFLHTPDPRKAMDLAEEEREAFFEKLYAERGLGIWQGNFHDINLDPEANAAVTAFIQRKIRERVKDPAVADRLVPKNHGFGTRRVPLETRYYEVFNQANVTLIDLQETPIERITPTGIQTSDTLHEFDVIIFATGFDAITGSFDRIDIRGIGDIRLRDKWTKGPITFLGVHTTGFPNFFMPGGPLSALGNHPRALEYNVDWTMGLLRFMEKHGFAVADVRAEAEAEWTAHAHAVAAPLLASQVDSWFTGINTNIDGKNIRTVIQYRGGASIYRARCDAVVAGDYAEFSFK